VKPRIPKKHQPNGYEILYEDRDLFVGNKAEGFVTMPTKWDRGTSIYDALNHYVRKGNIHSRICVYAVHRLDQATSGALIFAKTERAQFFLKDNWPKTTKTYFAIAHGKFAKPAGKISSYLLEDDDYVMHSNQDQQGKLAHTEYQVLKETDKYTLLKINLLTGRKNQIRVHLADEGHPLVGDAKYGDPVTKFKHLALHSRSIAFDHPHTRERIVIHAEVPEHFHKLVAFDYESS
jgi:tRNA pseudouridine32 synthase/23S rRNA pseudouridine746 synthase/23S rRNA pseudouridine1911/1915/1917 synthase